MTVIYDFAVFAGQRAGGVSRYFVELVRALRSHPDIACRVDVGFHANVHLAALEGAERVKGWRWPLPGWCFRCAGGLLYAFDRSLFVARAPTLKADIHHMTNYELLPGCGRRRAVTVYDMAHERFPELYPPEQNDTASRKAAVMGSSDLILCISNATRDDVLDRFPGVADRTRVVYLGTRLMPVRMRPQDSGAPFFLHVGERRGYKNGLTLLRAFARLAERRADCQLVFFGGPKPLPEERAILARHGIQARVRFCAGDDRALSARYAGAVALVYPSAWEGFGLPIVEAMQAGCPVITTGAGALAEVAGGHATICPPYDVEAWVAAMDAGLSEAPGTREARTTRARLYAETFTWERCAAQTADAYRAIL